MTNTSSTGGNVLFEFTFATQAPDPDKARHVLIARARKVRALADRPGTPEEGVAARALLTRLLADNGLTLADLDGDDGLAGFSVIMRSGPRTPGGGTWAEVFRNAPEAHGDPSVVRQARRRG